MEEPRLSFRDLEIVSTEIREFFDWRRDVSRSYDSVFQVKKLL
jgi:hypothetical protein